MKKIKHISMYGKYKRIINENSGKISYEISPKTCEMFNLTLEQTKEFIIEMIPFIFVNTADRRDHNIYYKFDTVKEIIIDYNIETEHNTYNDTINIKTNNSFNTLTELMNQFNSIIKSIENEPIV